MTPKTPPEANCKQCTRRKKVAGEKYCHVCRASVLKKLGLDGYLQPIHRDRRAFHPENRHARRETRDGID